MSLSWFAEGPGAQPQRAPEWRGWEHRAAANSQERLGSQAKHLGTNGSRHMLCISYFICKELQPLCKVSSCSKSIWALLSAFSEPATGLSPVPFHCHWKSQTSLTCKLGRPRPQ